MRIARVSVGRLMAVVGLVALNLAAARFLASYHEAVMLAVMPTALVCQFALFRLTRTRGGRRAFWAGFLAAGCLAMFSVIAAIQLSGKTASAWDPTTGKMKLVVSHGVYGGDQMRWIWRSYVRFIVHYIWWLPSGRLSTAMVYLAPQLLVGLAVGLLTWLAWKGFKLCQCVAGRRHPVPAARPEGE